MKLRRKNFFIYTLIGFLIFLTGETMWNASLYRDGIHPNAAGNKELAEFVRNAIKTNEK